MLIYTCTSDGVALVWQENGAVSVFNSPNQINTMKQGELFTFFFLDIINGSMYISTAIAPSTSPADNDVVISCTDGSVTLSMNVTVAGTCIFKSQLALNIIIWKKSKDTLHNVLHMIQMFKHLTSMICITVLLSLSSEHINIEWKPLSYILLV